jgi:hypothetical protein
LLSTEVDYVADMIDFMHNGVISEQYTAEDGVDHLVSLIEVADKYRWPLLVKVSTKALGNCRMTVDVCNKLTTTGLDKLGHMEEYEHVLKKVHVALLEAFKSVEETWRGPDFLALKKTTFLFLVGSKDLEANDEDSVFVSALEWADHTFRSLEERGPVVVEICHYVRFATVRGETLRSIFDRPDLSASLKERIMAFVWYKSYSESGRWDWSPIRGVPSFSHDGFSPTGGDLIGCHTRALTWQKRYVFSSGGKVIRRLDYISTRLDDFVRSLRNSVVKLRKGVAGRGYKVMYQVLDIDQIDRLRVDDNVSFQKRALGEHSWWSFSLKKDASKSTLDIAVHIRLGDKEQKDRTLTRSLFQQRDGPKVKWRSCSRSRQRNEANIVFALKKLLILAPIRFRRLYIVSSAAERGSIGLGRCISCLNSFTK